MIQTETIFKDQKFQLVLNPATFGNPNRWSIEVNEHPFVVGYSGTVDFQDGNFPQQIKEVFYPNETADGKLITVWIKFAGTRCSNLYNFFAETKGSSGLSFKYKGNPGTKIKPDEIPYGLPNIGDFLYYFINVV